MHQMLSIKKSSLIQRVGRLCPDLYLLVFRTGRPVFTVQRSQMRVHVSWSVLNPPPLSSSHAQARVISLLTRHCEHKGVAATCLKG
jgi:hypothetical protein